MTLGVPVPLAVAVPCAAAVWMLQVKVSFSPSVAWRVMENAVGLLSSSIVAAVVAPSVMTGATLATWIQAEFAVVETAAGKPSPLSVAVTRTRRYFSLSSTVAV
jgi:hypothetical protein